MAIIGTAMKARNLLIKLFYGDNAIASSQEMSGAPSCDDNRVGGMP